jgi:hypothetical protein
VFTAWKAVPPFYCQIAKNTNKKSSLPFSDRPLSLNNILIFYSKLPLARRILSFRPPPVTGIFTVNLPHNLILNQICSILSRKK